MAFLDAYVGEDVLAAARADADKKINEKWAHFLAAGSNALRVGVPRQIAINCRKRASQLVMKAALPQILDVIFGPNGATPDAADKKADTTATPKRAKRSKPK